MVRFTANFPRVDIEHRFPFEVGAKDWLISIAGHDMEPAKVKAPFNRILFIHFDDVEEDLEFLNEKAITEQQAKIIADFIKKAQATDKNVWVNCHAGMCRSGAIVEVLALLGWQIVEGFSPQRIPNRLVFNLVRQQFDELLNSWEKEK